MLEQTIVSNLIYSDEYCRKVLPFLKADYFDDPSLKKLFTVFGDYVAEYKAPPSKEALRILVDNLKDVNESAFNDITATLDGLKVDPDTSQDWLLNETEKFCQDKDLFNAIRRAILILDGKDKELDKGSIPKLLSDSLGVSFETNIGHDFLNDSEDRFDFYHIREERLPFDLEILNKITKGGLPKKSLTVLLATTGGGKSLMKCHVAASALMQGKNVLYVTLEMAEERIAQRIDANLLDVTVDELMHMDKASYSYKIQQLKKKTPGKLIIKEYPTGSAHAGHFRYMLNELRLKKNFVPDLICIDYLNICASSRIKGDANSYTLVKSVAEELRGLAMEFDCAILTSSQYNRSAYGTSDVDLTNTSESMGLAFTADAIFALISTDELEELGQIMIKQLKNRWGDLGYYRKFLVGIERAKMKLFDLEASAQDSIQGGNSDKPQSEQQPDYNLSKLPKKKFSLVDGLS